jgi:hypothetical protein
MENLITPRVKDLLEEDNLDNVFQDAETIGYDTVRLFFNPGASKAPIKKEQLKTYTASACILGEMKSVQRILNFLETSEVIDGFDPNHDFIQALYGELSMYLLKLDRMLLLRYGFKSNVSKKQIEDNSQKYLDNFYSRRLKIHELQKMLTQDDNHSSQTI